MTNHIISLPIDAEVAARSLDLHADFRVLRRLQPMDRPPDLRKRDVGRVGIALDVETTGLDPKKHQVIELAMQRFRIDETGFIIETGRPQSWLEQPTFPIPPEIERVTGLKDADVQGRSISEGEATSMIRDADFVIAHNASFDRPFVEARLPLASGRPWVCSLADIDWRGLGYEGRTLSGLLSQMGCFFSAHRAQTDVSALLHLLDQVPSGGNRTFAAIALEQAEKPSSLIEATGAPFASRTVLRERGYRWNPSSKVWSMEISSHEAARECEWLRDHVYGGQGRPTVTELNWQTRYSLQ